MCQSTPQQRISHIPYTLELGKITGVSLYGYSYSLEPKWTGFARFGLNGTPAQSFVALMSKSHGRDHIRPWDFDIRAAKDTGGNCVMPYVAHFGPKGYFEADAW